MKNIVLALMTFAVSALMLSAQPSASHNAKAAGMGGTGTAINDGPNSAALNPGSLGFVRRVYISATAKPSLIGLDSGDTSIVNGIVNLAFPVGWIGTTGLSVNYFNTSIKYPSDVTLFRSVDATLSHGFALPIESIDFGVGLGLKLHHWSVPEEVSGSEGGLSKNTFNLNFGAYLKPIRKLKLGVSALNLLPMKTSVSDDGESTLPTTIKIGAAFLPKNTITATFDTDMVIGNEFKMDMALGSQLTLMNSFNIRVGAKLKHVLSDGDFIDKLSISGGLGYKLETMDIDIAYEYDFYAHSAGSISASVTYNFEGPLNPTPPAKIREVYEKKAEIDRKWKELEANNAKLQSQISRLEREISKNEDEIEKEKAILAQTEDELKAVNNNIKKMQSDPANAEKLKELKVKQKEIVSKVSKSKDKIKGNEAKIQRYTRMRDMLEKRIKKSID